MIVAETEEVLEKQSISTEKAPAHYVNNKEFLAALIEYKQKVDEAKAEGKEPPQVTRYIGECFIKIATHLSYKSNFINYTFRDDMVSDGIENCLTAAVKFDPDKSFTHKVFILFFIVFNRRQNRPNSKAIDSIFFETT
jgi:hypothetical protein